MHKYLQTARRNYLNSAALSHHSFPIPLYSAPWEIPQKTEDNRRRERKRRKKVTQKHSYMRAAEHNHLKWFNLLIFISLICYYFTFVFKWIQFIRQIDAINYHNNNNNLSFCSSILVACSMYLTLEDGPNRCKEELWLRWRQELLRSGMRQPTVHRRRPETYTTSQRKLGSLTFWRRTRVGKRRERGRRERWNGNQWLNF